MKGYLVKLVRDRIGERVGPARGFHYEAIEFKDQHVRLLREKLGEEVVEYLCDPSLGELVDILQALEDLAVVDLGKSWMEVEDAADRKFRERGGFRNGTVMIATDEGYNGEPRPEWGEG